jgi:tetratricopeptide (TPR) repeat protein
MKRTILTGMLALVAGATLLMAQATPPAAPAGQAAPAAPAGPHPKSAEEATALRALLTAENSTNADANAKADAIVAAGEDVITKFPSTDYKEMVLTMEAMAYEMKGDLVKEQVAWQRVLETSPKSIPGNLKMGDLITKQTHDKDLDVADELARAEKYLNTALAGIKADEADPAMAKNMAGLKQSEAEAHETLGLAGLTRASANKDTDPKKYDPAIAEFRAAADGDPAEPAYQARLAWALEAAGKHAEALQVADKVLALPNLPAAIKPIATSVHDAATRGMGSPAK